MARVLEILTVVLAALPAMAAPASAEERQGGYHLFKPVPKGQLRTLAADRPDATESPQTVDAGHAQLEMDVAAYLRDRSGADVEGVALGTANIKLGLTHNVDLQLVLEPYSRVRERAGGVTTTTKGFGDITLRVKVNLWGNDGDRRTAFAVMPFVVFPTSEGKDDVEGGVILTMGVDLPQGWGLGIQLELDVVRNGATDVDISHTIVLGHDIVGALAGFVEIFSLFPGESGADWVGTFNVGLTYALNDDVQLDVGAFIGLSNAADDFVIFCGFTWRF